MKLDHLNIRFTLDRCVIIESTEIIEKKIFIAFEDAEKADQFIKTFKDESLVKLWMESSNSQEDFDPEKLREYEISPGRFWRGTRKLVLDILEKMDGVTDSFEMESLESSMKRKAWWNSISIF